MDGSLAVASLHLYINNNQKSILYRAHKLQLLTIIVPS
jgi:hypothetical protein